MWRLLNNILPTNCNLVKKGISLDVSCPFCQIVPEPINHIFLSCDFSKRVFFSPPLGVRLPNEGSVYDWLSAMLKNKDWQMIQVVGTGMWKIWNARNAVVFKKENSKPQLIAQSIVDSIMEFNLPRNNAEKKIQINHLQGKATGHWSVQTDAGCFDDGVVALGCVIREPNGDIHLAASKKYNSHEDPASAELNGIQWGMNLAKELKIEEVMFYSDAMGIVDSVNGTDVNAALDPIIKDCRNFLGTFRNASLLYLCRTFNSDAHHMVKVGKVAGARTWLGNIPNAMDIDVCLASLACS